MLYVIEFMVWVALAAALVTQVVIPLLQGRPLLPIVRSKEERQLREKIAEAEQAHFEHQLKIELEARRERLRSTKGATAPRAANQPTSAEAPTTARKDDQLYHPVFFDSASESSDSGCADSGGSSDGGGGCDGGGGGSD